LNHPTAIARRYPLGLDAIRLTEPDQAALAHYFERYGQSSWSYPDVGATRDDPLPEGWDPDHHTVDLGPPEVFETAVDALGRWVMFDLPWVRMYEGSRQVENGVVAFASRQYGFWMLHACRVVYRIDEPDRVGFGYGTLAGHAVAGEEQFLVHRDGSRVCYSVRKFSRLSHPVARLGARFAMNLQRYFSVESGKRMQQEVQRIHRADLAS
jgi:uncharacterized protein (UPF0548 family)